jgi:dipeptidyl aminopeptidase/acylaminoacyl peptidase
MQHLAKGAVLAACASLVGVPAFAQERDMTIEDVFEIRHVGSAALSPDGGHIAYTLTDPRNVVAGEENGASDAHLWIAPVNGEGRPYVAGDIRVGDVAWRPGAGTVTFTAQREGDEVSTLYEIDPDGGEAQKLFAHDTAISSYAWGPRGEQLYFVAGEEIDAINEGFEERGFRVNVYEENLAFSRVWRVDVTADEAEAAALELEGHASAVEISDDGRRLAVALQPTPLIDDYYMNRRWHVVDARDGDVVSVIETPGKTGDAEFSPDGRSLALLAGVDRNDTIAGTLHVADARTGEFSAIAADAEQHVMDFEWAGEDEIVALVHAGLTSALATYSTDGEEFSRVAQDDTVIHGIDLHRASGRLAAVADAPDHPRELFNGAVDGDLARNGDHNPWLDDVRLGEQRGFEYESRDGLRVEGVLITPRGERPEGGWPLILTVHGGPEAHYSNGWLTGYSTAGHVGAGRGFAVFYPNYRGSTGRGEAFTKLHQDDYAGGEFNDLVDGVDALAEAGIVDRDRVGITGGSYGGYASMWGATALSEHFAASVAFVGISNQISKVGTTDIPTEMYHVHALRWPWEDNWMNLLERSPVYHAGNSETPTLILHGEEDTRVHPSQSMELYRNLRLRSEAPVRLITYPGEGHGNDRAAAQLDYAHRLFRWMEHYLTGEGGEPPAPGLDYADILGEEADGEE